MVSVMMISPVCWFEDARRALPRPKGRAVLERTRCLRSAPRPCGRSLSLLEDVCKRLGETERLAQAGMKEGPRQVRNRAGRDQKGCRYL
jgi:hypothetical protein